MCVCVCVCARARADAPARQSASPWCIPHHCPGPRPPTLPQQPTEPCRTLLQPEVMAGDNVMRTARRRAWQHRCARAVENVGLQDHLLHCSRRLCDLSIISHGLNGVSRAAVSRDRRWAHRRHRERLSRKKRSRKHQESNRVWDIVGHDR